MKPVKPMLMPPFQQVAGFSGSRDGVTAQQRETLYNFLQEVYPTCLHHGDCVGADAAAHDVAHMTGIWVEIHPPVISRLRAYCTGPNVRKVHDERGYIDRDHDIVDQSDYLVACPRAPVWTPRSGTWATITYAQKVGKPVFLINPDGQLDRLEEDG